MGELNGRIHVVRDHIRLDKESMDALKDFIGKVWLMRQSQKCWETIPEGKYLRMKKNYEESVDWMLRILVKSEEVTNG